MDLATIPIGYPLVALDFLLSVWYLRNIIKASPRVVGHPFVLASAGFVCFMLASYLLVWGLFLRIVFGYRLHPVFPPSDE